VRSTCIAFAIAVACRGSSEPQGLPPASSWGTNEIVNAPSAPAAPAATPRFTECLARRIAKTPMQAANALRVFARVAPAAEARAFVRAIADRAEALPPPARAKVLGEAAWALADAGAMDDARAVAAKGAALPPDGAGGRLTALAALGRVGAIADALALADDVMSRDVVAFGAAVGGHRAEAARLRAQIEADPVATYFVHSAIHVKTVAALGDVAALTKELADRAAPTLLPNAGAAVEGGTYAHDKRVTLLAIDALAEARGVPGERQAIALVAAAGIAAAGGDRDAVVAAVAAFDRLPATARGQLDAAPAVSFAVVGAIDEARRRLAKSPVDALDRAMIGATIDAVAGRWDSVPRQLPPDAVLAADLWGRALAAALDAPTAARVLDAICPP
jgi:hypothetical protein